MALFGDEVLGGGIVGGFETSSSPRLALCLCLSPCFVPVVLGVALSFLWQLPCLPAVMSSRQQGDGLYLSGTIRPNKPFPLYVALVLAFCYSDRKITNAQTELPSEGKGTLGFEPLASMWKRISG